MKTDRKFYTDSPFNGYMGFTYKAAIPDGEDGAPIFVNNTYTSGITCTLIAGAGTGKFQFTTSPDAEVVAGTAVWQDWSKGVSTGTVVDVIVAPITALRGVSIVGEMTIEAVA